MYSLIIMALMLYLTDFSTASKMLNLNNPIQETVRFRSVGLSNPLLFSVPKGRDNETVWQKSVICYIRAIIITSLRTIYFIKMKKCLKLSDF